MWIFKYLINLEKIRSNSVNTDMELKYRIKVIYLRNSVDYNNIKPKWDLQQILLLWSLFKWGITRSSEEFKVRECLWTPQTRFYQIKGKIWDNLHFKNTLKRKSAPLTLLQKSLSLHTLKKSLFKLNNRQIDKNKFFI